MTSHHARVALALAALHSAVSAPTLRAPQLKVAAGDRIRISVPAANVCDVTKYGARGDGKTDDTAAIQAAINACGGGDTALLFPSGHVFSSFGITLPALNNFIFEVQPGATLLFNPDVSSWPANSNCITVTSGGSNLAFTGGGIIDGSGAGWWPNPKAYRPTLLRMEGSSSVLVSNLTWRNSPNHQLEMYANDAEVVDCVITAPADPVSHNTDGIDVHGSPFWIHRCNISTGDDNIAMHANDTLVEDCVFGAGHGASIGSLGGAVALKNITVRRVSFTGTTQAVRIKTDQGASGFLTDVTYDSINMTNCGQSILVTMYYTSPAPPASASNTTLKISNVTFSNIAAVNSGIAGSFTCDPSSPCEAIHLINIAHTGTLTSGWSCQAAHGDAVNVSPTSCLVP